MAADERPAISVLGIPHDENSSYRRGAATAPDCIRAELSNDAYSLWSETGFDLSNAIVDLGDVPFSGISDPWTAISARVSDVLGTGRPLVCLGGDHAVSHPVLRAIRPRCPDLTIVHIDAHPDIYDAYLGNRRSHTSSFARIMEERLCDRLIQIGIRTANDEHRAQYRKFGVESVSVTEVTPSLDLAITSPVYISLDLDALDPAFAPGVSHREPGGLSTRQVIDLLHGLTTKIVAADIVEFNPACDIDGVTAVVAAKMLKEIAGLMLRNRQH